MASEAAELDDLDPDVPKKPKAPEKPKEETPPDKPKEEETPPGEVETPPEKPEVPEKPVKAADLRKAYEESQRKIRDDLNPKVNKLEARIRELESSKPKEIEPLQQQLASVTKRNAELEKQVEFLDYKESPKFKKEFWDPYVAKYNEALNELRQVEVDLADGGKRRGTEDDLLELWNLESGALRRRCNELFGDSSDDIVPIVKEVQRLGRAQSKALEDAQKGSEERIAARRAAAITDSTERARKWKEYNGNLAEKYPTFFKPIEGDTEGNKRLAAGHALTGLLFHTDDLTSEQKALLPPAFRADLEGQGRLSPDNIVRLHALIMNKASNHDRAIYQLKQARDEIKELRKSLAEFEASEPPGGGGSPGGGSGGGHWNDDADAEIDKLDRAGR